MNTTLESRPVKLAELPNTLGKQVIVPEAKSNIVDFIRNNNPKTVDGITRPNNNPGASSITVESKVVSSQKEPMSQANLDKINNANKAETPNFSPSSEIESQLKTPKLKTPREIVGLLPFKAENEKTRDQLLEKKQEAQLSAAEPSVRNSAMEKFAPKAITESNKLWQGIATNKQDYLPAIDIESVEVTNSKPFSQEQGQELQVTGTKFIPENNTAYIPENNSNPSATKQPELQGTNTREIGDQVIDPEIVEALKNTTQFGQWGISKEAANTGTSETNQDLNALQQIINNPSLSNDQIMSQLRAKLGLDDPANTPQQNTKSLEQQRRQKEFELQNTPALSPSYSNLVKSNNYTPSSQEVISSSAIAKRTESLERKNMDLPTKSAENIPELFTAAQDLFDEMQENSELSEKVSQYANELVQQLSPEQIYKALGKEMDNSLTAEEQDEKSEQIASFIVTAGLIDNEGLLKQANQTKGKTDLQVTDTDLTPNLKDIFELGMKNLDTINHVNNTNKNYTEILEKKYGGNPEFKNRAFGQAFVEEMFAKGKNKNEVINRETVIAQFAYLVAIQEYQINTINKETGRAYTLNDIIEIAKTQGVEKLLENQELIEELGKISLPQVKIPQD